MTIVGESSNVTFSQMARYSPLTILHIFRTTAKSYREKSLFASVLKFMCRAVKGTKICSVPRIFKTDCKLFVCAKGNTKQKEIVHLVDPDTKQRKQSFEF